MSYCMCMKVVNLLPNKWNGKFFYYFGFVSLFPFVVSILEITMNVLIPTIISAIRRVTPSPGSDFCSCDEGYELHEDDMVTHALVSLGQTNVCFYLHCISVHVCVCVYVCVGECMCG